MAFQGSKSPIKAGMKDATTSSPIDPRSGAAKRPQTVFPVRAGMKDQTGTTFSAGQPGKSGPDASSPNPLDPTVVGKKVQTTFPTKWTMRDANGGAHDGAQGRAVLSEGKLTGRP